MKLEQSPGMAIRLVPQVHNMFLSVSKRHITISGEILNIPMDLEMDFRRFMRLKLRHEGGDFRHSLDELKSMENVAAWINSVNDALCAQSAIAERAWGTKNGVG